MGRLGFRAYILKRRVTATRNGDFVEDSKTDRSFPDAGSLDELLAYPRRQHACREALAAAKIVWSQYLRYVERQRARPAVVHTPVQAVPMQGDPTP